MPPMTQALAGALREGVVIDLTGDGEGTEHIVLLQENPSRKKRRTEDRFLRLMLPPCVEAGRDCASVIISWIAVEGAFGYQIRMKGDQTTDTSEWCAVVGTKSHFSSTKVVKKNLELGRGHVFSVRPVFSGFEQEWGWSGASVVFRLLGGGKRIEEVFRDAEGNFLWVIDSFLDGPELAGFAGEIFDIPRIKEMTISERSQRGAGGLCSGNYAHESEHDVDEVEINLMYNYRVQSRETGKKEWLHIQRARGFFRPKGFRTGDRPGLYIKGRGEHDWDSCLAPQRETKIMRRLRSSLSAQLSDSGVSTSLNTILINCYEDGGVDISAHSDETEPLVQNSPIVTLSLFEDGSGDSRDFVVRAVAGFTEYAKEHNKTAMKTYECSGIKTPGFFPNPIAGAEMARVRTKHGQLIVMGGPTFQERYTHEVPKHLTSKCGPRISLTFREYAFGF